MNEQERALDLHLAEALDENKELKAEFQCYRNEMREEVVSLERERDDLLAENEKLSDLWSLIKAERDALKAAAQAALDALKQILPMAEESLTRPNLSVEILDAHAAITQLRAALSQPEQVKPWVGLTHGENHIAEVLNKTLGLQYVLQYVADKLREKNT